MHALTDLEQNRQIEASDYERKRRVYAESYEADQMRDAGYGQRAAKRCHVIETIREYA